ncbi:hypothetical protein C6Q07_05000 [Burkholderia multivorans]|nr:hypothetical protein C6Q07_05000 [Burkholderia multivorans]
MNEFWDCRSEALRAVRDDVLDELGVLSVCEPIYDSVAGGFIEALYPRLYGLPRLLCAWLRVVQRHDQTAVTGYFLQNCERYLPIQCQGGDEGHSKAVQGKQGCSVIDLARLIFRQETNGPPTTKYFPASLEPLLEAL